MLNSNVGVWMCWTPSCYEKCLCRIWRASKRNRKTHSVTFLIQRSVRMFRRHLHETQRKTKLSRKKWRLLMKFETDWWRWVVVTQESSLTMTALSSAEFHAGVSWTSWHCAGSRPWLSVFSVSFWCSPDSTQEFLVARRRSTHPNTNITVEHWEILSPSRKKTFCDILLRNQVLPQKTSSVVKRIRFFTNGSIVLNNCFITWIAV